MYCKNCGKIIDDDSTFCIRCGIQQNVTINPSEGSPASSQKNGHKGLSKLDIRLLLLITLLLITLSLWGGFHHWQGPTFGLRLIMIPIGAIYLIYISIRLCAPVIGSLLGLIIALSIIVPCQIFDQEYFMDIVYFIGFGCLFGLIVSTIYWIFKR